jgi:Ca2+-binding RTX toxin-like protein
MILDIAALQRMYGADFSFNATDTVYRWNPLTGEKFVNGVGNGVPSENVVFETIWDGGGIDTYDFSAGGGGQIDLRPGHWSNTGSGQGGTFIGFGYGNVANALLFEDDPRSLIENAIGGVGNNMFVGNAVRNQLTGGGGGDTFRWYSIEDVGFGATADEIMDFSAGDWIDLSEIDADTRTAADESFVAIGRAAFSGVAGQLRYDPLEDGFRLFGDVDGDAIADFELVVQLQAGHDPHMPVFSDSYFLF